MTLYELTDDYLALLELAQDPDVDPDIIADTMEGIKGAFEDKADGYAKVIAQLDAEYDAVHTEVKRLMNRMTTLENSAARIKNNLERAMIVTGKTKFKTTLFSFGIQKNPPSVALDVDPDKLPDRYLVPQPPKVDRKKLKDDLKNGMDLNGIAHLHQESSLRIR